jgi:hypothetical protein
MLRRQFLKAGLAALLTPLAIKPAAPPPPKLRPVSDLYISPEALADIRAWTVADVDPQTRREIFMADGPTTHFHCSPRIHGQRA